MKKYTRKELEAALYQNELWDYAQLCVEGVDEPVDDDEKGEKLDLSNADLSNIDVSGLDLGYFDLSNANLNNTNFLSQTKDGGDALIVLAIGNGKELISEVVGGYKVVYTKDILAINVTQCRVQEWEKYAQNELFGTAIEWWEEWNKYLFEKINVLKTI